jgi:uncharacterized protein YacL
MNNNNGQKKMLKHGLGMMVCCMLPILVIAVLPLLGIRAAWMSSVAALICPLSMVFMMFGMGHSHGNGHSHDNSCCHQDKNQNVKVHGKTRNLKCLKNQLIFCYVN